MTNETQELPSIFQRQPDQQFDVMDQLLANAKTDMETSTEKVVPTNQLEFAQVPGTIGLRVVADPNVLPPAFPLKHYSLNQAAKMAKYDVSIIERLSQKGRSDLAVDSMNTLFPNDSGSFKILLLDANKNVRALNGQDYSRLWDFQMFSKVQEHLIPNGFVPAIARKGCGALLAPGRVALFRGDQTSFGFFFTDNTVQADPVLGLLRQGIMIWNSEVGARSFGFSSFYFREESGVFILWDRHSENRKRFVHRGDISRGFREYMHMIRNASSIANGTREQDLATFNTAANTPFAESVDAAIQKLNEVFKMPKAQAEAVVKASMLPQNASGPELSVWRISLGISYEAAQTARAESMVDDSVVGSQVIRRYVK